MSAIVTISFVVGVGYLPGDYAVLFGNDGSGDVDYNTPLSGELPLYPNGAGIYGFGRAPWGRFYWGRAFSMKAPGFGHLPFGRFPWGCGSAVVQATHEVFDCGDYKFAFGCYDQLGNAHSGSPEEICAEIHIAPDSPEGLTRVSYNKTTDVLILAAA